MLYMVSYDLMTPGQNYGILDQAIKQAGGVEVLRSQWVLVSTATADALWRDLSQRIDSNDRLWVTELTSNMQWRAGALMIADATMQQFMRQARV